MTDVTYQKLSKIQCKDLYQRDDLEDVVDTIFDYWRRKGFPYYDKDRPKTKREIENLFKFDTNDLNLEDNHLQQYMLGLATANAFHPQMWSIHCGNEKSPMDVFMDDNALRTAIEKRIKYGNDAKFAPYVIRKSIKIFGGQSVSNFRPTIAKWVYDHYCPENGVVLDPCAGYGGRLFGAYCSNNVKKYVGVDPSNDTCDNNREFASTLEKFLGGKFDYKKEVEIINKPFEDYNTKDKFDLVFTSPPYFDTERYTDFNQTQSYIRYPEYGLWLDKFLGVLIQKSYECLNKDGYFVLNVGQKDKSNLYSDTRKIGDLLFGEPEDIYHMRLSRVMGSKHKSQGHKTEPLIVWKKR